MKIIFAALLTMWLSHFASAQGVEDSLGHTDLLVHAGPEIQNALTQTTGNRPPLILQKGKLVRNQSYDRAVDLCYFYSPDAQEFKVDRPFLLDFVFKVSSRDQNAVSLIQRVSRGGSVVSGFAVICGNDDLAKERGWSLERIQTALGDFATVKRAAE